MPERNELVPVTCKGRMSFISNPKVDICSLEARTTTYGHILGLDIKRGYYDCYSAIHEDGKHMGALMLVHETYPGEELVTDEKIGEITVGISGIVGFFRNPKTEYSFKQLGQYIDDLNRFHVPTIPWAEVNSRQFISPSAQTPGSAVDVWGHRDGDGKIDALRIEFRRVEEKDLANAVKQLDKEGK